MGIRASDDPQIYPTWQESRVSVVKLGIKKRYHYTRYYKEDGRLPSSPDRFYKDFPGWSIFLNKGMDDEAIKIQALCDSVKLAQARYFELDRELDNMVRPIILQCESPAAAKKKIIELGLPDSICKFDLYSIINKMEKETRWIDSVFGETKE